MRIITFLLFILIGLKLIAQQTDNIDLLNEGDQIPEFIIGTTQGDTIMSSDLQDKVTIIVFFATWCPPCVKELPHVQKEMWEKYKTNDKFRLFVVGREHTKEEVENYASDKGFNFPLVADTNRAIFKVFASQNIPRMYLIDKNLKIVKSTTGFNIAGFENMIELLDEQLHSL